MIKLAFLLLFLIMKKHFKRRRATPMTYIRKLQVLVFVGGCCDEQRLADDNNFLLWLRLV
jgi:hypothetical protein